jgi:hypothetical protein
MRGPRPGWLIALCAAVLIVSAWLPWLTTRSNGGGRVSAIGGAAGSLALPPEFGAGQLIVLLAAMLVVAGAMAARGLSARWASAAALVLSLLVAGLTGFYYRTYVTGPVAAGYGFYIGAVVAVGAVVFSVWTLIAALGRRG